MDSKHAQTYQIIRDEDGTVTHMCHALLMQKTNGSLVIVVVPLMVGALCEAWERVLLVMVAIACRGGVGI